MNRDDLMQAVTELDEEVIEQAAGPYKKKRKWIWAAAAAAVLALAVILPFAVKQIRSSAQKNETPALRPYALATPLYPVQLKWEETYHTNKTDTDTERRLSMGRGQTEPYRAFLGELILKTLEKQEDNAVMSPVNLFFSMAMLSEITDGKTRTEILNAVGAADQDELRTAVNKIWEMVYNDDGKEKMIPANSLWLADTLQYNEGTVNRLAESYYASVFRGTMGTAAYNSSLQSWINAQTDGILREEVKSLAMDKDTDLALVSTVLYQTKWAYPFDAQNNKTAVFHGENGDAETTFMFQQLPPGTRYYYSDKFAFVQLPNLHSGKVWLFLPDEGVSVQDMMAEDAFRKLISEKFVEKNYCDPSSGSLRDYQGVGAALVKINLTMPKVDISRTIPLKPLFDSLGITSCFNAKKADFSPILKGEEVCLTCAEQTSRIMMDEEGVQAASYVDYLVGAMKPPEEEVDFTLDRPFFFLITGEDGVPYFAGVMNDP
ncbi:MAG: hypothetical protein IJK47_02305 [Lachnospiraceae bacterium]|nr:hypothetical protein [Lachnospiraceae bacterium]